MQSRCQILREVVKSASRKKEVKRASVYVVTAKKKEFLMLVCATFTEFLTASSYGTCILSMKNFFKLEISKIDIKVHETV